MKPRILLVDDEADIRGIMSFILAPIYDVTISACSDEAIRRYEDARLAKTPFDLLILDIAMAEKSGLKVGEHVRESGDLETKIVFHTGYDRVMNKMGAEDLGAVAYWVKPLTADVILSDLERIFNAR